MPVGVNPSTVPLVSLSHENITISPDLIKKLVKFSELPNELELYQILQGEPERSPCPQCLLANQQTEAKTSSSVQKDKNPNESKNNASRQKSRSVQWFFGLEHKGQDSSGRGREIFDHHLSSVLEEAYETPNAVLSLRCPGFEAVVDLANMTLTNLYTNQVFSVTRVGPRKEQKLDIAIEDVDMALPGAVAESKQEEEVKVPFAALEIEEEEEGPKASMFVMNRGQSLLRQASFLIPNFSASNQKEMGKKTTHTFYGPTEERSELAVNKLQISTL